ncbi:MAG: hypothetical protein RL701_4840 [Pseudomonadota bacterium]|jgi:AraC-like DNA-binding protein
MLSSVDPQADRETQACFRASVLRPVVRALSQLGCDYRAVLASAGYTPEDLERPELRIAHVLGKHVFARALEISGDPAFGLRCAEQTDLSDIGTLSVLIMTAPTVGDSVDRMQRYSRLLHDAMRDWGELDGEIFRWCVAFDDVEMPRVMVETVVGASVRRLRFRFGHEWAPHAVWVQHAAPAHVHLYQDFFRCPVRFGAPYNAVEFEAADLLRTNPTGASLTGLVERRADAELAELTGGPSLANVVRTRLIATLGRERVDALALTRHLHMSRATMTRRLKLEGTTLTDLIAEVRRDFALEYLRDPQMSIEELARCLDFSDARAFRRAFQRWTGLTPLAYRRSLMAAE